jgi:hypothetical protein
MLRRFEYFLATQFSAISFDICHFEVFACGWPTKRHRGPFFGLRPLN